MAEVVEFTTELWYMLLVQVHEVHVDDKLYPLQLKVMKHTIRNAFNLEDYNMIEFKQSTVGPSHSPH